MGSRFDRTIATYEAKAADYLARHRDRSRIEPVLRRYLEGLPAGPVLDLGCGPGFDGHQLRLWGRTVVGLDRTLPALRLAVRHHPGRYACADMRHLPLRGSFAGVWACASMLHLEPDELGDLLGVLHGLLRPGGLLWLSLKEGSGGGWDHTYGHDQPRWFTYWSATDLNAALEAAGFAIEEGRRYAGPRNTWLQRLATKAA